MVGARQAPPSREAMTPDHFPQSREPEPNPVYIEKRIRTKNGWVTHKVTSPWEAERIMRELFPPEWKVPGTDWWIMPVNVPRSRSLSKR